MLVSDHHGPKRFLHHLQLSLYTQPATAAAAGLASCFAVAACAGVGGASQVTPLLLLPVPAALLQVQHQQ
jgi:hypothetical protein